MSYTPLHLHTQYSLLDGAILIPELMDYCKEHAIKSCAITDHGWMAGVIDFYKQCKANDIKPLIGVELYVTGDEDNLENADKNRDNQHLVVIAKDNEGYKGLLKLVSLAALNNFYYKPRVYRGHLSQLAGHVCVTSACLGGPLSKLATVEKNNYGKVTKIHDPDGAVARELDFYQNTFGGDFYLEVQDWDSGDYHQPRYNEYLLQQSLTRNIHCVITSDAHYLRAEDHGLHTLLMAMQHKQSVAEYQDNNTMQYGPYFYVKTPEEMLVSARKLGCEEAFHNTNVIAEKCNVEIELGVYKQPRFNIEEASDFEEFQEWQKQRADST